MRTKMLLCAAALVFIAGSFTTLGQVGPRHGYLVYKGPKKIDIYMGICPIGYNKIEFYVDSVLVGTTTQGAGDAGIVTAPFANSLLVDLELKFYLTIGGTQNGQLINLAGTKVRPDYVFGVLTHEEEWEGTFALSDTVWVTGSGQALFVLGLPTKVPLNIAGVNVPGGKLVFKSGMDATYVDGIGYPWSSIQVLDAKTSGDQPGEIEAKGGILDDVNIDCEGKFAYMKKFTAKASDINLYGDYPVQVDSCVFDWNPDRSDFAIVLPHAGSIVMRNTTVQRESQVAKVDSAINCRVLFDASIDAKHIVNCTFDNNGQVRLRPADTPTSCRNSKFTNDASIQISNESIVEFNEFGPSTILTISPQAGGFDPSDVAGVHVNYNSFLRDSNAPAVISTSNADTIDVTKNYWGQCTGPDPGELINRKARIEPFLRAALPEATYWVDITRSKDKIIANNKDSVQYFVHVFNVLTGADSANASVTYSVKVFGSTIAQGAVKTDANGRGSFAFKITSANENVPNAEVYIEYIQCIEYAGFVAIQKEEGADLTVDASTKVAQVQGGYPSIVGNKPFVVVVQVEASEPVPNPFRVIVKVNGTEYGTFYEKESANIDAAFAMINPKTEISLSNGGLSLPLVFFIDNTTLDPGTANVEVVVDPPEGALPEGRIAETEESNNTRTISVPVKSTVWSNTAESQAKVFVQPIDSPPGDALAKAAAWADSAKAFMESAWPLKSGQMVFTVATEVGDYKSLEPDSLTIETWQRYLVKAYKQLRMANPNYDRYVFAVDRNWFFTRMHHELFNRKGCQTLAWSGVYDLAVSSMDHHKHLVHTLGHTYHLRRGDFDPTNEDQQEQYYNSFVGIPVGEGYENPMLRIHEYGVKNKSDQMMKSYCFMGNSDVSRQRVTNIWVSDIDYKKLFDRYSVFTNPYPNVNEYWLISGSVDSANHAFTLDTTLIRFPNAVPSPMVDDLYAKYFFEVKDENGAVIYTHNYTPTFRALGLDEEGAENPEMQTEYFAFVLPAGTNATMITVKDGAGNTVAEHDYSVLPGNPPVVRISPADGDTVKTDNNEVVAHWGANNGEAGATFSYSVYLSTDGGQNWQQVRFESPDTTATLNLPAGNGYKLRVVANDGVRSGELIVTFHVKNTNGIRWASAATDFALHQNHPNPFASSTTINFTMATGRTVQLDVFDALGRKVTTLINGYVPIGSHSVKFDASTLTDGTYLAVLRSGDAIASMRILRAR